MQRNCPAESRRQCVLSCQQLATVLTSLNKFADNEVELRHVGGVNAPVGSRDPVYNSAAIALARYVDVNSGSSWVLKAKIQYIPNAQTSAIPQVQ